MNDALFNSLDARETLLGGRPLRVVGLSLTASALSRFEPLKRRLKFSRRPVADAGFCAAANRRFLHRFSAKFHAILSLIDVAPLRCVLGDCY